MAVVYLARQGTSLLYTIRLTQSVGNLKKVTTQNGMTIVALWETTNVYQFKSYLHARFYANKLQDLRNSIFEFPAINTIIRDIDAVHAWFPHNVETNSRNPICSVQHTTKSDYKRDPTRLTQPELRIELLGYLRARVRVLNIEIAAQKRVLAPYIDRMKLEDAPKKARASHAVHERFVLSHSMIKSKYPDVYKTCLEMKAVQPLLVK